MRPLAATARPRRRWLRRLALLALLTLLIVPPLLLWLALDTIPVVILTRAVEAGDTRRARILARRTVNELLSGKTATRLTYTEAELNSMLAMAARSISGLRGRVNISDLGLEAALSQRLTRRMGGLWINLRVGMQPSNSGLVLSGVQLGRLAIGGDFALGLVAVTGNLMLGDHQGSALLDSVEQVRFQGGEMLVGLAPPSDLRARLRLARERFKDVRDEVALLGDPLVVRLYCTEIVATQSQHVGREQHSVAEYVSAVFRLASLRTRAGGDPATENRAAVLALAIWFGDQRFARLVGPVMTDTLRAARHDTVAVVLAERRDLRLHFIISAGLKIVTDSGISLALGEFKELSDSDSGGSGFSFADLAADRAGVHFATLATTASRAGEFQQRLARPADEALFFPDITNLPEGLSEAQFRSRYGNVDDPRYSAALNDIDQRITARTAYRDAQD